MTDIKQVLETVDTVMTTIKAVADTPGVNLIPYVSTASAVIGAVHTAYTAGKNIEPYLAAIKDTFSGTVPTQAEIDALDAKIAVLEAEVDTPLPPPDQGESD